MIFLTLFLNSVIDIFFNFCLYGLSFNKRMFYNQMWWDENIITYGVRLEKCKTFLGIYIDNFAVNEFRRWFSLFSYWLYLYPVFRFGSGINIHFKSRKHIQ